MFPDIGLLVGLSIFNGLLSLSIGLLIPLFSTNMENRLYFLPVQKFDI